MRDQFLVKKPWITEKSTHLGEIGKYVFLVKDNATKNEMKKMVKELYQVDAKSRRYRGMRSEKPGYKKAIVTLKAGQKIDLAR